MSRVLEFFKGFVKFQKSKVKSRVFEIFAKVLG